jgi:transcriptional repressor NrdR
MNCPFCRSPDSRVIDSRAVDDGNAIRRRRECPSCERRFSTLETASLSVLKRSGVAEPFNREKIVVGVKKACQGRGVPDDQIEILVKKVEDAIRGTGQAEVKSEDVGLAILAPLRDLDEIAYIRFASVYRGYATLDDFEEEIARLRAEDADR